MTAVDIQPTSSPKLKSYISQPEAVAFSTKHNLELLLAGDNNARHPMWGDRLTIEHGRNIVNTLHDSSRVLNVINHGEPTSVSINGSSIIDLFMTSEKLTETTNLIDQETELFTGAPTRGHFSVRLNIKEENSKGIKLKKT